MSLPVRTLLLIFAMLATALSAVPSGAGAATPPAPNIVLFIADDQPAGTLATMPNVRDQIVDPGVVFRRAYVSNPLCCPSRSSILTGGYSHTTGVYANRGRHGGFRAFYEHGNEDRTIAAYLDPTYQTGLFGKYLNGYPSYVERVLNQPGYVPAGWDEWQAFYETNGGYEDYALNVDGRIVSYGSDPGDFSTDVIGERFIDWLDPADGDGRDPSQPFFAVVAPFAPHLPAKASPTYGDEELFPGFVPELSPAFNEEDVADKPTYVRQRPLLSGSTLDRVIASYGAQRRSAYSFDRQIGFALDYLRNAGLLQDTFVIFVSDNGLGQGEHRWITKQVPYERSIRVPLAIRYDRLTSGGVDRRSLVANVDIFPTVIQLALGIDPRSLGHVDGLSLVDTLGDSSTGRLRSEILLEGLYTQGADVPTYCGIVTGGWKYVVYSPPKQDPTLVTGPEDAELYDLRHDPDELENVAASDPAHAADLRIRLAASCEPTPPGWSVTW